MLVIALIILSIGLLGITVYGLHKYQVMEVEYSVDRTAPLPSLREDKNLANGKGYERNQNTAGNSQSQEAPIAAIKAATAKIPTASAPATATATHDDPQTNWKDKVAAHKAAGDITAALAACATQFPLWGAYNQACVLLRGQLKMGGTSGLSQEILARLYKTAAMAELLHDKSSDYPSFTLSQLKKLDLQALEQLSMPYTELGHAYLRLIKKGDVKLMQEYWGQPSQHTTPRKLNRIDWVELTSELSN